MRGSTGRQRRAKETTMRRTIIGLAVPLVMASALLVGAAPAAAGGGGCYQPDTQGTGTSVTLTALCFSPTILYVQPGATVTWKNDDGLRHLVAGSFSVWGSPTNLEEGQSVSHKFPTAGIFAYSCPLHYGMNAVVIVGDGKASVPLAVVQPAVATRTAAVPQPGDPWPLLALLAAVAGGALGYGLGRRPTVTRP
jgi:plastocyanin